MLAPEQAQDALKQQHIQDWDERRSAAVAGLGGRIAELGRPFFDKQHLIWRDPQVDLDGLSSKERTVLFDVMFPRLGRHLEAMWSAGIRMPYQTAWYRRAFRAPRHPAISLSARVSRLHRVMQALKGYAPDALWVARWAGHLSDGGSLGFLLAAVLDGGGAEATAVYDVLVASAKGEDEVGRMGRHVTHALLTASRPDGWAFVESLLLAAQREEGLRQAILEAVDESHPGAFRLMAQTILAKDLGRFSSVVRAVDVWFGYQLAGGSARDVRRTLELVLRFLDDTSLRDKAMAGDDPESAYLALCCEAFEDAVKACESARTMLRSSDAARRFAAATLLRQLRITVSREALAPLLDDRDLRVARVALGEFARGQGWDLTKDPDRSFERLERLLERVPEKGVTLEPLVWPWTGGTLERAEVASALVHVSESQPLMRVARHLPDMAPDERYLVAKRVKSEKRLDGELRRVVVDLAGDASATVREAAIESLQRMEPDRAEIGELEKLLSRKAGDLRRGIVRVLLAQSDNDTLASADRLMADESPDRRLAGLELLRIMHDDRRSRAACETRARAYRTDHAELVEVERVQLDAILGVKPDAEKQPSLDDALGLAPPAGRAKPAAPRKADVELVTAASMACLRSLDDLIHEHREARVTIAGFADEKREQLLGDLKYGFARPAATRGGFQLLDERVIDLELPLREIWARWWTERPAALRDADGHELSRALASLDRSTWMQGQEAKTFFGKKLPELRYPALVQCVLEWSLREVPASGSASFLLTAAERGLAMIPQDDLARSQKREAVKRTLKDERSYVEVARMYRRLRPDDWTASDLERLWRLLIWFDRWGLHLAPKLELPSGMIAMSTGPTRVHAAQLDEMVAFFRTGVATEIDLAAFLMGPGELPESSSFLRYGWSFHDLGEVSRRRPRWAIASDARLSAVVRRCRERIIEVELRRGEAPTAASAPALCLTYSGGLDVLMKLLLALGKEPFVRGWRYDGQARSVVFSHLIRTTFPTDADTPTAFAERARDAKISQRRLVELGAFAPQWAGHVETAVGWPGLTSALWWLHAHTKDSKWTVAPDIREAWAAETAERTALTATELLDGAVDAGWFSSAYEALGAERWSVVDVAAKYTSTNGGHVRARLYGDALRGAVTEAELQKAITAKRSQDSVRALGLLPLKGDREKTVLARYEMIQEFIRGAKQFGAARQASEKRAAEIALENLARTAGYADPVRLSWAMEARGIADLAEGPLAVESGGYRVSLALDPFGEPELEMTKEGRAVKTIPADVKKQPAIAALRKRQTDVRRQHSRARLSLETAMVRGDRFSGREVRELTSHALLGPLVSRLVIAGDGALGYPVEGGRLLEGPDGKRSVLADDEPVRVAHALDLLASAVWTEWQRECLACERIQPFKQVFREVYVPTKTELAEPAASRRYAGHQVQPRRALALLGARGWVNRPEEGVRRTFHDAAVTAWLTFTEGFYSPADIDGLTLEQVRFSPPGTFEVVPLDKVPPRIFSEVMRDLDLVVSVAHLGGVDPEASASSIEMRAALVRESARVLELDNVRVEEPRVFVEGRLGSYNVHLGSAVVHRQPGGALFIVPVHSQYRGRIFLPFADDDPKSAEVLSKVLMLARDWQIKDPTILEQLRAG